MIRGAVPALAVVVLITSGCTAEAPAGETQAAIDDARVLWHQAEISSYRLTIEWFCFCAPAHRVVEIIDGEIEAAV